jgi:hypothetical protein
VIVIPLVFAVLFALSLVAPVSELLSLPAYYDYYGISDAIPWPVLVAAVVLPVVLYVVALLLGRGRPPFARALIFAVALATSFALHLGAVELVLQTQPGF